MKNTNTLYEVYRKTAIPDETYPEYNAGYDLTLVDHIIVSDDNDQEPMDLEGYELKPIGILPKESKIC